jgi:hypothetical protein
MQWLQVAVVVLSVAAMTGCPSEFGKDGRVSTAVHKDVQEQLVIKRCSDAERERVCGPGKKDSKDCRECGG